MCKVLELYYVYSYVYYVCMAVVLGVVLYAVDTYFARETCAPCNLFAFYRLP